MLHIFLVHSARAYICFPDVVCLRAHEPVVPRVFRRSPSGAVHARHPSAVLLTSALRVGALHGSVFWLTRYLQLLRLSILGAPRMQGCSEEQNYSAKEFAGKWAATRFAKVVHTSVASVAASVECSDDEFGVLSDGRCIDVFQSRYLLHELVLLCSDLPRPCVSFNLLKQSEWCVWRTVARCESASLPVAGVAGGCASVFEVKYAHAL